MSPAECLPNEISFAILSYLSCDDLASASRVSHVWHAISQPLLYKEPTLIIGDENPSSLYLFLRTLLTPGRESLANHVRTLVVDWTNIDKRLEEPVSDLALLKNTASRLQLSDPLASDGAQVVLLLHLLPCLHSLHAITPDDCDEFDDLMDAHHATQHIASLPLAFQSLRQFVIGSAFTICGVGSTTLFTILRLPHIRVIDFPVVYEDGSRFPEAEASTTIASSSITHLTLSLTDLSESALGRILSVPRALTHFSYSAMKGCNYDFAAFSTALHPLQNSLYHLDIDFFLYANCSNCYPQPTIRLPSLRQWPALRSVRTALFPLLGRTGSYELARMLPVGLTTLEIILDGYWPIERVVDVVVVMLEQKGTMLPRLKWLMVLLDAEKSLEVMERLGAACKAADVQLVDDFIESAELYRAIDEMYL